MNVKEILTLNDVGQQLTLLKKNCNRLTDADIKKNIRYYWNAHPIKSDPDRADQWILDDVTDPITKMTTKESHKVRRSRLALPYQQQIVSTACAFTFGNKIDLILNGDRESEANKKAFELFQDTWDNQIKAMTLLRKVFRITSVETRCAINFYYEDGKIRAKILSLKDGYKIYRHKDENDKLDCVVVEYNKDIIEDGVLKQSVPVTEIWTPEFMREIRSGKAMPDIKNPIDGGMLLFAFFEQDMPEFEIVKDLIDNQDYSRSQHSDVNVRIGNPALIVNGNISKKPRYNDDTKIYEVQPAKGFEAMSNAKSSMSYLEISSAPESVRMEMTMNDADIYKFTWPNLYTLLTDSNFGNLSGQSIRLMFTQAFVKLAEKQEIYDEMIPRMISILKELTSIATGNKAVRDLQIGFKYNSLLPDSVSDTVNMLSTAVGAGITSQEQAVRMLSFNTPDTLDEIEKEGREKVQVTSADVSPRETNPPNEEGINGR